jgi:hypothetical protein
MGVQFTFSLVLFALVAKWYISPAIRDRPLLQRWCLSGHISDGW